MTWREPNGMWGRRKEVWDPLSLIPGTSQVVEIPAQAEPGPWALQPHGKWTTSRKCCRSRVLWGAYDLRYSFVHCWEDVGQGFSKEMPFRLRPRAASALSRGRVWG